MPTGDPAPLAAALRWTVAFAIVLALHGLAARLLLTPSIAPLSLSAAPDAVMLDLAPDLPPVQSPTLAPPTLAAPPPPPIPAPAPPPPEALSPRDISPVEQPQPMPPRPESRPKPKPTRIERRLERQPTPPVAEAVERPFQPVAPAPVQAPPQASPRAPTPAVSVSPSWRSDLLGRLQRAKRYPDLARSRGDQGVATVTFTMDRGGRIVRVNLVGSSGSTLLDDEAVALVHRAEPLPSLPDEMPGSTVTLTVPISFTLR